MHEPGDEYQVLTEMKVPDSFKQQGFVYVLKNEFMPDVYKIGMTTNCPDLRAKEISSTTGVPTPFTVLTAHHSKNPRADERMIHEAFSRFRISEKREFFRLDKDALYSLLNELRALVGPERNADVAELALYDSLISFHKEDALDLEAELIDSGLGGYVGEKRSATNFLIRLGISYMKSVIAHKQATFVIDGDGKASLIKNLETQWEESQHEQ
ncbi:GIY-YIG nuclease family protein [Pantoea piersonii]|uniref:GIY-YIG nuclease family protein n=1 Tax=Pantoea piersonii TaxID=2364647 RepID=UPI0028A0C8AC|nr:GIY-YIG nuclease family protein [Pantoea piersonii]